MQPSFCPRLPRAGVDPIDRPEVAMSMVGLAISRPFRDETIVLLLDGQRRGIAITVVSGTTDPDDVLEVVECLTRAEAHGGRVGSIVLASVRPTAPLVLSDDIDRWLELSAIADESFVELLEWFVIGDRITCPRDELGEAPRW
jgi:hypothetical protein